VPANCRATLASFITEVSDSRVAGELPVVESVMAPNGYLHAGTIVTLADTVAGYGCVANLPAEATGFTTIELKSNHLGTARDGTIIGVATPVHRGRTTQVWDAVVVHKESGRTLAVFSLHPDDSLYQAKNRIGAAMIIDHVGLAVWRLREEQAIFSRVRSHLWE